MVAEDGIKVIVISFLILLLCIVVTFFYPVLPMKIITGIVAFICLFNFYFFRDPERSAPEENDLILSPADGTVVLIEEVDEPYYFKSRVRRVSIFLSVFNVHVNRMPVNGTVEFLKYIKGKFLVAFADKASEENEQSIIGIRHSKGKLLFKQIAGIIARRIIYHVHEGDDVKAGDRFGLIRYGSRVDMFFPENVEIKVSLKDKVYGGESIIGEFK
jgi:phosphatidylserine decarboxylase